MLLPSAGVLCCVASDRLTTMSVPRTVADLDVSNNPLVSAEQDARASMFVRMRADDAYARHVNALNLSRCGLRFVPHVVPALRCLTSLQLARNRIAVSLPYVTLHCP